MVRSDFHSLFWNCLFDCLSLRTDYRNKMETTSCCFVDLCLCARFGFTTTILAGGICTIHRTTGPMACLNCFRSNIFDILVYVIKEKLSLWLSTSIWSTHLLLAFASFTGFGYSGLVVAMLILSACAWIPGVLTMRRGWRLFGMVDLVIAWTIMASELMNGPVQSKHWLCLQRQ